MKFLIITQKVDKNDPILGFFHRWIVEFAKKSEQTTVICLEKGEYDLPENTRVLSLGKEEKLSRCGYVARFYRYILRERKNYDVVFVHMNPIYIVLGGLFWRVLGKDIGLWYTHKSVDLKLRVAEKFAHFIFTASKESFRLHSSKLRVIGHGIDINQFEAKEIRLKRKRWDQIEILHIGRVTPIKNVDVLVDVARILKDGIGAPLRIVIVGCPMNDEDRAYEENIKLRIKEYGLEENFIFYGSTRNDVIPDILLGADILINLSDTGSIDKVILEAMASSVQVLTSNEAFFEILPPSSLTSKDPTEIAKKIVALADDIPESSLRNYVAKNHSISNVIAKITSIMT